jgi:hypothetical protein
MTKDEKANIVAIADDIDMQLNAMHIGHRNGQQPDIDITSDAIRAHARALRVLGNVWDEPPVPVVGPNPVYDPPPTSQLPTSEIDPDQQVLDLPRE